MFEEIGYQCYVIAEGNKLKQFGYVDEETIETIVYPMKIDQTLKNMFLEYIEETNEDDNNRLRRQFFKRRFDPEWKNRNADAA